MSHLHLACCSSRQVRQYTSHICALRCLPFGYHDEAGEQRQLPCGFFKLLPPSDPQGVCPVAIMMMRQGSGGDRPVAPCLKLLPLSCSDSFSPQALLLQLKASASTHIPTGVLRGVCPVAITMRQGNRGSYPLAPSKPLRAAPARMKQSARHQAMRATLGPIANGCKFILACGTSYTEVSLSDTHSFICGS